MRTELGKAPWALLLLLWGAAACGVSGPNAPRGQALFDTCVPCHGTDGSGNPDIQSPAIAGLPQWYVQRQLEKFQAGIRGAHADDIPGLRMRPMAVTLDSLNGDIPAVAAYVASLTPVVAEGVLRGNAGAGAPTFGTVCIACHGTGAEGNELLGAPPLVRADDWYLLTQLRNFRSGVRGADARDTWGLTMRANALPLSDEGMEDVLAFIRTLR